MPQTPVVLHGRRPGRPTSSGCCATATCSCTIPTTRSRRRWSSSSSRPPPTRSVLAIKQTIYRTAGAESCARQLAGQGRRAGQAGGRAGRAQGPLRRAGQHRPGPRRSKKRACTSCTDSSGLKTHAKILLVVRQEADGIRRYCHVGTGNYNPKTAHLYEDVGLLSADPELGADLTDLFNHLTGYSHQGEYRKLLVAPVAPAPRHRRPHRAAGRARRSGPHHPEDEQPGRPRAHRRALRRVAARHADRPRRAGHLLPAPAGRRAVREHPRAVDRRSLPRALPGVPLRRRARNRRVPHRIGRPHAPQPRPPGRGAHAGHRSPSAGPARRDARARPHRRRARVGARGRRHLVQDPDHGRTSRPTAPCRSSRSRGRTPPDRARRERDTGGARAQVHPRRRLPTSRRWATSAST